MFLAKKLSWFSNFSINILLLLCASTKLRPKLEPCKQKNTGENCIIVATIPGLFLLHFLKLINCLYPYTLHKLFSTFIYTYFCRVETPACQPIQFRSLSSLQSTAQQHLNSGGPFPELIGLSSHHTYAC